MNYLANTQYPCDFRWQDQTVRNIVFTSVAGNQIRIRLSNTFGKRTLTVGRVSVGIPLTGAQLVPGTTHPVTFGGHAFVTIPVGAEVVSDPVPLKVAALEQLAVSLYLPTATGRATYHFTAQQTGYIASGDQASATAGTSAVRPDQRKQSSAHRTPRQRASDRCHDKKRRCCAPSDRPARGRLNSR